MAVATVERPSATALLEAPRQLTPIPEVYIRGFEGDAGQTVLVPPSNSRKDAELTTDYITSRTELNKRMNSVVYSGKTPIGELMHEVWSTAKTMRARGMDVPLVPYEGPQATSNRDRENYLVNASRDVSGPNDYGLNMPAQGAHIDRVNYSFRGHEFKIKTAEGEQGAVDPKDLIYGTADGEQPQGPNPQIVMRATGEYKMGDYSYAWKDPVEEGLVWRYKMALHEVEQMRQTLGPRTEDQKASMRKFVALKKVISRKGIDLTHM